VASAAVAEFARTASLGYIPGAMTPAEIYAAHSMSAICLRVFPADALGPRYIARVLQPMAVLKLLPTGGITIDAATDYLRAGAIGRSLPPA
jgi:2-dehydro-3-deoxyphosphogluconate aldolase / (4S)-4-hydroxy-2-oxoglutarate aldolase